MLPLQKRGKISTNYYLKPKKKSDDRRHWLIAESYSVWNSNSLMFWTSFHVLRTVQVEMEAGSLNIFGRLVVPFGRHSDAHVLDLHEL